MFRENDAGASRAGYVMEQAMRFSAALTCILLSTALFLSYMYTFTNPIVVGIITFLWVNFVLGAFGSPKHTCAAFLFNRFIRAKVKNPRMEHVAAPRFAQLIGFVFLTAALTGITTQWVLLFVAGAAGAFIGAFINAAFNYCIACRLYRVFTHTRRIPVFIADEKA